MKTIFVIVIIIIITFFTLAYLSNSLVFFGLCKPGDKLDQGLGRRFCYTPSGFEGNLCDKATDCGTGGCALLDSNKETGKGICRDLYLGCNVWIDEKGKFNENEVLCVD